MRLGQHAGVGDSHEVLAEVLNAAKEAWPVPLLRSKLLQSGISSEADLAKIEEAAAAEVEKAMAKAMTGKVTPAEETLVDVYADPSVPPRRGHYPKREAEKVPETESKPGQMLDGVRDAQDIAMTLDKGVFLLGEDIGDPPGGVFGTSKGLQTKYGKERVRPTPIAETALIGAGIGASLVGMRPVAEIMFNDFAGVGLDQVFNNAPK